MSTDLFLQSLFQFQGTTCHSLISLAIRSISFTFNRGSEYISPIPLHKPPTIPAIIVHVNCNLTTLDYFFLHRVTWWKKTWFYLYTPKISKISREMTVCFVDCVQTNSCFFSRLESRFLFSTIQVVTLPKHLANGGPWKFERLSLVFPTKDVPFFAIGPSVRLFNLYEPTGFCR